MAVGNYSLVVGINCGGNYCAITSHWQSPDDSGGTSFDFAKDLAQAFIGEIGPGGVGGSLLNVLSEDSFISSLVARKVGPVGGNSYARSYAPADQPGQFSGNLDAAQVAGVAVFLTAGDAGLNGRMFVPGVSEEAMDGGRFVADYKSAFLDLMNDWIPGLTGLLSTWTPVLKHGSPPSYTAIVHGYLSVDAGTQRRRRVPV